MSNIVDIVNEANKYYEHAVTVGDKTITIGIKHGLSFAESAAFVEEVVIGSRDEDGKYNPLLHEASLALQTIQFFTDIDTSAGVNDLFLFWNLSNLKSVIEANVLNYQSLVFSAYDEVYPEHSSNKEFNELCGRVLAFLDDLNKPGEFDNLDEEKQKEILDKVSNADWKGIVQEVINGHAEEWDKKPDTENMVPKLEVVPK